MRVTVEDITGVVGIVPTPATSDAERWDATNTVNLPETEKMIRAVVEAGIDVVMTTGTFGECATLTWQELQDFVACVVETAAGRRPVFAGITTLNTRDTIERGRRLVEIGADGLFVGRPMWLPLDDRGIVRYYRDISEAIPGVPLVVYDNPFAFKGKMSTEVYGQLGEIPEVVAAKHVGGPALEGDLLAVGSRVRILPLEVDWYPLARKYPDVARACWSGGVACAPSPMAELARAIERRDWVRAEEISGKLQWACEPMFPGGSLERFIAYSIQLGHVRFKHAGLIDPGPTRPPYLEAPDEFISGSVECGRRWAQLEAEFAKTPAGDRR
jgi:dihydrodipicolinate synthase/N-acetylneuraminate lyase